MRGLQAIECYSKIESKSLLKQYFDFLKVERPRRELVMQWNKFLQQIIKQPIQILYDFGSRCKSRMKISNDFRICKYEIEDETIKYYKRIEDSQNQFIETKNGKSTISWFDIIGRMCKKNRIVIYNILNMLVDPPKQIRYLQFNENITILI